MTDDQEVMAYKTKDVDLDVLLSEIGGGFKIAVTRQEPRWCDGYLDTLEVDGDEPINLETIRQLFGGRKMVLKISGPDGRLIAKRTVKFPDEPMKDGVVLKNPAAQTTSDNNDMKSFMSIMAEAQKENSRMFVDMQKEHNRAIQDLMLERMKELKSNYGNSNGNGNGNGNGDGNGESLSSVLTSIESIEAVKEKLMGTDDANPLSAAVPQVLGMAEMALEKYLDSKMQQKQALEPQSRPLPNKVSQTETDENDVSDEQFILKAIQRVQKMPETKRNQIASLISEEFLSSKKSEESAESNTCADDDMRIDIDPDDAQTLSDAGA